MKGKAGVSDVLLIGGAVLISSIVIVSAIKKYSGYNLNDQEAAKILSQLNQYVTNMSGTNDPINQTYVNALLTKLYNAGYSVTRNSSGALALQPIQ